MKSILILTVALVAGVLAAPSAELDSPKPVEILENEFKKEPDNTYTYKYKTADGISFEESGQLKELVGEDNKPQNVIVVKGSYSYADKEGKPVSVTYFADETGFHAEGDTIPKATTR